MQKTYNYDELFHEDEETGELIFTIPPETLEENGWNEGDLLRFETNEETQTLTIIKVGEKNESDND